MRRNRMSCPTCGNRLTPAAQTEQALAPKIWAGRPLYSSSSSGKQRCPQCGHPVSFGIREFHEFIRWYRRCNRHQETRWAVRVGTWPRNPPYFTEELYRSKALACEAAKEIGPYAKAKRVTVLED